MHGVWGNTKGLPQTRNVTQRNMPRLEGWNPSIRTYRPTPPRTPIHNAPVLQDGPTIFLISKRGPSYILWLQSSAMQIWHLRRQLYPTLRLNACERWFQWFCWHNFTKKPLIIKLNQWGFLDRASRRYFQSPLAPIQIKWSRSPHTWGRSTQSMEPRTRRLENWSLGMKLERWTLGMETLQLRH